MRQAVVLGAVAQLALQVSPLRRLRDPVDAFDAELPALPGFGGVAVGDVHEVALEVLGDDVPRAAAEAEAEALAYSVEPVPLVPSELAAAPLLENGSLPFPEAAGDEFAVVDLAEEADPLAVLAVLGRQSETGGQFADLLFLEVADREEQSLQLPLAEVRKEVGLVLDRVGGAQQNRPAVLPAEARVMPGGDGVAISHPLEEGPELDALVAEDVRARCAPGPELAEGVVRPPARGTPPVAARSRRGIPSCSQTART